MCLYFILKISLWTPVCTQVWFSARKQLLSFLQPVGQCPGESPADQSCASQWLCECGCVYTGYELFISVDTCQLPHPAPPASAPACTAPVQVNLCVRGEAASLWFSLFCQNQRILCECFGNKANLPSIYCLMFFSFVLRKCKNICIKWKSFQWINICCSRQMQIIGPNTNTKFLLQPALSFNFQFAIFNFEFPL